MKTKTAPAWDAVIVGGGIAGLMAAHELRDFKVLVIKKERRSGGRVLTRSWNESSFITV